MRITSYVRCALVAGAFSFAAAVVEAQAPPSVTAPKNAANRAAAATNTHIERMQNTGATSAQPQAPAASPAAVRATAQAPARSAAPAAG
ncbi:MAG: hypothetical protein ACREON_02870, partial [Gemmatimonadaceae bacterium]